MIFSHSKHFMGNLIILEVFGILEILVVFCYYFGICVWYFDNFKGTLDVHGVFW